MSERPKALRAAAIGAAGAILNLVGILVAAVVMERNGGLITEARRAIVEADLGNVVSALEAYHDAQHTYPETLSALQQGRGLLHPVGIIDQGAGLFTVRTYQYVLAPDGSTYDLFSVGKDGQPGTGDDVRPALPDSILDRAGYRPGR